MGVRRLRVPGRYDQLDRISDFVGGAAKDAGLDAKAVFHCQLATDEACTNIIEHGYGGEGRGEISITCQIQSGRIMIELQDSAGPFDPTSVPSPNVTAGLDERSGGGYGIHFIRQVMDQVEYRALGRGNLLRLVKVRR